MNVKNLVLGIAIIIVTISVVVYGINTFYDRPEYEDYCEDFKTVYHINTSDDCVDVGGRWNDYEGPNEPKDISGWCERDYACRQEYQDASETYRRNIFIIAIPLGILIIALGALAFDLDAVGAGLMGGGVGTIIYGVGGFWRYTEDWLKFIISLIGLVALIWLSYYFNKKFLEKGKRKKK